METKFRMIDVGKKPVTHRLAVASGEIQLSAKVRRAIEEKSVPKGDVLALAEIAGIGAAKRTSDILPLCHPLSLDGIQLECELDATSDRVTVRCEVSTHGRTGVEMEALCGVSAALLCVYDLTKSLDKGAIISGIRLEEKMGGKSGHWLLVKQSSASPATDPGLKGVRAAVITASDRCSRGESQDVSGKLLAYYLSENGAEVVSAEILPDDVERLRKSVRNMAEKEGIDLVLMTGGTGIGPRDVTFEAIEPLWAKRLPGFGELFRSRGLLNTERAWLSRAEAGLVNKTLVALLPGSPSAVRDGLSVLDGMIPHMLSMVRGGGH